MKLWNNKLIDYFQISGLHVFSIAHRNNLSYWEPFYVGTHADPYFDERHTWEGRQDKMTQAYTLCLLGYEFHILDNAFLIHRPGIKKINKNNNIKAVYETDQLIRTKIKYELQSLFGKRDDCWWLNWMTI